MTSKKQNSLKYLFLIMFLAGVGVSPSQLLGQKNKDAFRQQRMQMVETAVKGAGITNPNVIRSIQQTERHEFMPKNVWDQA